MATTWVGQTDGVTDGLAAAAASGGHSPSSLTRPGPRLRFCTPERRGLRVKAPRRPRPSRQPRARVARDSRAARGRAEPEPPRRRARVPRGPRPGRPGLKGNARPRQLARMPELRGSALSDRPDKPVPAGTQSKVCKGGGAAGSGGLTLAATPGYE